MVAGRCLILVVEVDRLSVGIGLVEKRLCLCPGRSKGIGNGSRRERDGDLIGGVTQ